MEARRTFAFGVNAALWWLLLMVVGVYGGCVLLWNELGGKSEVFFFRGQRVPWEGVL